MSTLFDVAVIGGGATGLAVAERAARAGLATCIYESLMFGGLVVNINRLWPALPGEAGAGADLAAAMMTRIAELGVTMNFERVDSLASSASGLVRIGALGGGCEARKVVIATGAAHRAMGVPGEAEFAERGVSHCADCDGPLYRGKAALVAFGGDSALQEALVIAAFCDPVHLVHRGAGFSARPEFIEQVAANARIRCHMQSQVVALQGGSSLQRATVNGACGATQVLECAVFIPCVGLDPNTAFLPAGVARDAAGCVVTDATRATSMPHVYAAGAVRSGFGGLLTDAMADAGTVAASIMAAHAGTSGAAVN